MTTPRNETIAAARGASFPAHVGQPQQPNGHAVIVLQEIFGANAHIRDVAGRFAAAGFVALAPALYDPVAPGIELTYDEAGTQRGVALRNELGFDRAVDIVAAAAERLHAEGSASAGAAVWRSSRTRAWACRPCRTTARARCPSSTSRCAHR